MRRTVITDTYEMLINGYENYSYQGMDDAAEEMLKAADACCRAEILAGYADAADVVHRITLMLSQNLLSDGYLEARSYALGWSAWFRVHKYMEEFRAITGKMLCCDKLRIESGV